MDGFRFPKKTVKYGRHDFLMNSTFCFRKIYVCCVFLIHGAHLFNCVRCTRLHMDEWSIVSPTFYLLIGMSTNPRCLCVIGAFIALFLFRLYRYCYHRHSLISLWMKNETCSHFTNGVCAYKCHNWGKPKRSSHLQTSTIGIERR